MLNFDFYKYQILAFFLLYNYQFIVLNTKEILFHNHNINSTIIINKKANHQLSFMLSILNEQPSKICMQSLLKTIPSMLSNSARYFDRIGHYTMCNDEQQMKYRWISFLDQGNEQQIVFNAGLCVAKQCEDSQIWQMIDGVFQNMGISMKVIEINSKVNLDNQQYNTTFYITLSILFILVMLTILSTLKTFLSSKILKQNTIISSSQNSSILSSFSIQSNLKIFAYKPSQLNIFNGIKAYLMLWIILGHQYFFNLTVVNNMFTFQDMLLKVWMLVIQGGMLAVDGFLFVGGFFVGYGICKMKDYNVKKVGFVILNRLLRFRPVLITTLLFFYSIFPHLGSGPYWSSVTAQTNMCKNWWRSALFIDNLYDWGRQICMSWSWYLQIDIQIFIFCSFILLIYQKNNKLCISILTTIIFLSLGWTFYMNYSHKFKQAIHLDDFGPEDTSFVDVYTKPWCRCAVYLYGIIFACFYLELSQVGKICKSNIKSDKMNRKIDNSQKINNSIVQEQKCQSSLKNKGFFQKMQNKIVSNFKARILIEILGILLICFIIFIPRTSQIGYRWSNFTNSLYLTLSKPLFCIGLSLIIIFPLLGYKSILSPILDNKFTSILAKISFVVYLIHLLVVMQYTFNIKTQSYYNFVNLFILFIAHATIVGVIGIIVVLVIQGPMCKVQKIIMSKIFKGSKQNI